MPLVLEENINNTIIIGVWHCTESLGELEAEFILPANDIQEIQDTHLHKRKIEKFITRLLTKNLLQKYFNKSYYGLSKNSTGKPVLIDLQLEISISHCESYLTVLLTTKNKAGIDLQNINEKIQRVANRVFSSDELLQIDNKHHLLARAWSAKEAMFKYYEKGNINFKRDLFLKNIGKEQDFYGILKCTDMEQHVKLGVIQVSKNYQLVYCIEK